MKARLFVRAWLVVGVVAVGGFGVHCREGSPTGDPKTPANSPIPEIDQRERDPKGPPKPSLSDAG